MTLNDAMALVRREYPKAKLTRWMKGRYTFSEVQGLCISPLGRLMAWCRPEKAWKRAALLISRRTRR